MTRQRLMPPVVATLAIVWGSALLASQTPPQTPPPETTRPPGSSTAGQPKSPGAVAQQSQTGDKGTLSRADRAFITEAAEGGLAEVDLGRLATKQAANEAVKQFGQRMVDDHSKANDELTSLAQQKGMTVPTAPNAKQQATAQRLEKLQGAEFDKAYMQDMLQDHKKDVAAFEKASKSAQDADLKAWAGKTLPTLRDHLQLAQDTAAKVGAKGGSGKTRTQ